MNTPDGRISNATQPKIQQPVYTTRTITLLTAADGTEEQPLPATPAD